MARKRKNRRYFTKITDLAIIAFNKLDPETDQIRRNKIYSRFIRYSFDKLVENLINTYKFYNIPYDELHPETIAYLNEKIHKYVDITKGKSYSYFGTVAKNYLIVQNRAAYENNKRKAEVSKIDMQRNLSAESAYSERIAETREFFKVFIEYWDLNAEKHFSKARDIAIADSVIEMFRTCDNLEKYNKKALYLLIKERAGAKTQHITKVFNIVKKSYLIMYTEFHESGNLPDHVDIKYLLKKGNFDG